MNRIPWIALAILSVGAAPSLGAEQFIDLGIGHGGRVYVYGNPLVASTYRVRAKVTISGTDTTWEGLYVNGVALRAPRTAPPRVASQEELDRGAFMRRAAGAVAESASARTRVGRAVGVPDRADLLTQEYQREKKLVDSARREGPTGVRVFWHGGDPEGDLLVLSSDPVHPPGPGELERSLAGDLIRKLDGGYWVVVRDGGSRSLFTPPKHVAELSAEIEALKAGKPIHQSLILDRSLARDLQRPSVSLEQLKMGGPTDE